MIDYRRLNKKIPVTDLRLLFQKDSKKDTSKMSKQEVKEWRRRTKVSKKIEDRIAARIQQGMAENMKEEYIFRAIDIAWDGPPIQKGLIPLMQLAQGRVAKSELNSYIRQKLTEGDETFKKILEPCKINGKECYKIKDAPRVWEMTVNILKSYITRRHAAQCNRLDNWPFFRYHSRIPSLEGEMYADVMSQGADISADSMGYRHNFQQYHRDPFLYGFSVIFPRSFWYEERNNNERLDPLTGKNKVETELSRFGIDFHNPHPTQIIYDKSQPLAKVNQGGIGPKWIAHWDLVKVQDLPPEIWNKSSIPYASDKVCGTIRGNSLYWSYYYPDAKLASRPGLEGAIANDRKNANTFISTEKKDAFVLLTYYYEWINPKLEGIGDWDGYVWVRYTVANDGTIVYAEFSPYSIACCYGGINQCDSRNISTSPAHELMGFQDQMTRILTQMLRDMQVSLMQIWLLDKDQLDPDSLKYIENAKETGELFTKPHLLKYSRVRHAMTDKDPSQIIRQIGVEMSRSINDSFTAIFNLFAIVEKMQIFSPQELGQAAPRIITAEESRTISTSTDAMYQFIGKGLDEQRNAVKQMIYEGFRNCLTTAIHVPVHEFYPRDIFTEAGIPIVEEGYDNRMHSPRKRVLEVRVDHSNIAFPFVFDSRDNAQSEDSQLKAQNLIQLVQILASTFGQNEEIWQKIGMPRMVELVNLISRFSGAPSDLRIDYGDIENAINQAATNPDAEQRIAQLEGIVAELIESIRPEVETEVTEEEEFIPEEDETVLSLT